MSWNSGIRMNSRMSTVLQKTGISLPLAARATAGPFPTFETFEGCVLLKSEWEPNKNHVKVTDFPDKTGFECFINHVHLPFEGTIASLVPCLEYVAKLQEALIPFTQDRQFRLIISLSEDDAFPNSACTVRFHEIRLGENWIADGLEGYQSEAILVLDVPNSPQP
jgi:hypothetical protein